MARSSWPSQTPFETEDNPFKIPNEVRLLHLNMSLVYPYVENLPHVHACVCQPVLLKKKPFAVLISEKFVLRTLPVPHQETEAETEHEACHWLKKGRPMRKGERCRH